MKIKNSLLIVGLLAASLSDAVAQCELKTEKRHPEFAFIGVQIGPLAGQWMMALGKDSVKKYVRVQIDPKFVTVNEPFKKKAPIKVSDSLRITFEDGIFMHLGVEQETKALYEASGAVSYWRYYPYFVLSNEVLEKMSKMPIKEISIEIGGKKQERELNKRQQSRAMSAAQCLL